MADKTKTILISLITFMLLGSGLAYAEVSYTTSAHGNSQDVGVGYGVNRTSTSQYEEGHCAHCHEQHASIGGIEPNPAVDPNNPSPSDYLLFRTHYTSQTNVICYDCHGASTAYTTGITNYSYSKNFGGNTIDTTYDSTIKSAFGYITTSGSSHYLPNIVTQILDVTTLRTANNAAWKLKGNADLSLNPRNPCDACHNPHLAKRSCNLPGSFDQNKSAISRPSDHNNLWGDGTDERMSTYNYQPPYWSDNTRYEPDNASTASKANMPDYATFCTDCHNTYNSITSSNPRINSTPRSLRQIDWWDKTADKNDKHGSMAADNNGVSDGLSLKAPYSSSLDNKVLSCTDCHEPHGSKNNVFLIRTEVNDGNLAGNITAFSTTEWGFLCRKCHECDTSTELENIHHHNTGAPYLGPPGNCGWCHPGSQDTIRCNYCHFHGGTDTDWVTTQGKTPSNRRTF
jgi:hypothetical protein